MGWGQRQKEERRGEERKTKLEIEEEGFHRGKIPTAVITIYDEVGKAIRIKEGSSGKRGRGGT